eukprot:gene1110-1213_t
MSEEERELVTKYKDHIIETFAQAYESYQKNHNEKNENENQNSLESLSSLLRSAYLLQQYIEVEDCFQSKKTKKTEDPNNNNNNFNRLQNKLKDCERWREEWQHQLEVGSKIEIFAPNEQKWFEAEVLSRHGQSSVKVHYLGWATRYDQIVDLTTHQVNPPGTFFFLTKKKDPRPKKSYSVWEIVEVPTGNGQQEGEQDQEQEQGKGQKEEQQEVGTEAEAGNGRRLSRSRQCRSASTTTAAMTSQSEEEEKKKQSSDDVMTIDNKKKKKHPKRSREEQNITFSDWHCTICGNLEAPLESNLVVCFGSCKRAYHEECLGLMDSSLTEQWTCPDCLSGSHLCLGCGIRGVDYVDVFKCSTNTCGQYYHPHCIQNPTNGYLAQSVTKNMKKIVLEGIERIAYWRHCHGHDSNVEPPPPNEKVTVSRPNFRCARHVCDTCYDYYGAVDASDLSSCVYCPRAFHTNCIPPGSRFNAVCLVCPNHPTKPLPALTVSKRTSTLLTAGGSGEGQEEGVESKLLATAAIFYEQLSIPEILPSFFASDLQLQHDLAFRLPVRVKDEIDSAPKDFIPIVRNDYASLPEDKMPSLIIPYEGCECHDQCDENCLNYILRTECCGMTTGNKEGKVCSLDPDRCENRALQRKAYARTRVFQEGSMGWGLRAAEHIRPGQLVIEYVGEIIDENEMHRRMIEQSQLRPHDRDYYIMELDTGLYVDGKRKGNHSRFINHSCDPNCELQKWNVRGRIRIAIVAIRDIAMNEPLSYDYQFDTQEENVFKCYCGASKCRGTMAPKKKDRLAAQAVASHDKDLRMKLIAAARMKAKQTDTIAARKEEEWGRSYTSKYLPGDQVTLIRSGPSRVAFPFARDWNLFLPRNVNHCFDQGMLVRQILLRKRQEEMKLNNKSSRRKKTKSAH